MAKYDYGIKPSKYFTYSKNGTIAYNTMDKLIYCISNQFFDYLDAGIPFIAYYPFKITKYFEQNGVCIRKCIDDYDFDYFRTKRDELRRNVPQMRKKMSIRNINCILIIIYLSSAYSFPFYNLQNTELSNGEKLIMHKYGIDISDSHFN